MLLLLTQQLHAHLALAHSRLPAELQASLSAALDNSEAAADEAQASTVASTRAGVWADDQTVEHSTLVSLSQWARKQTGADRVNYSLTSLLSLTEVYAPPLAPRVRSAQLEAILDSIRLQQERDSYRRMTSLAQPTYTSSLPLSDPYDRAALGLPPLTVAEEWAEVRKQMVAVVNVLASMMAVATAVWWVSGGRGVGERLGLSMGGAFAIGAIEAFLYWRYFTQEPSKEVKKNRTKVLKFDERQVKLKAE